MAGHSDEWCPIDPCEDCQAEARDREEFDALKNLERAKQIIDKVIGWIEGGR